MKPGNFISRDEEKLMKTISKCVIIFNVAHHIIFYLEIGDPYKIKIRGSLIQLHKNLNVQLYLQ